MKEELAGKVEVRENGWILDKQKREMVGRWAVQPPIDQMQAGRGPMEAAKDRTRVVGDPKEIVPDVGGACSGVNEAEESSYRGHSQAPLRRGRRQDAIK